MTEWNTLSCGKVTFSLSCELEMIFPQDSDVTILRKNVVEKETVDNGEAN